MSSGNDFCCEMSLPQQKDDEGRARSRLSFDFDYHPTLSIALLSSTIDMSQSEFHPCETFDEVVSLGGESQMAHVCWHEIGLMRCWLNFGKLCHRSTITVLCS